MKNRITTFFPSLPFSSLFSRLTLSSPLLPFLTFLLIFCASQVATAQIPSNGLVGYWPFNGNANDESGNGNNGTVNGATLTTDRFGNANSAYSFNNNNTEYIEISESPELNNCPEITVSFWTKVLSWSQYNMFIGKTGNNATTWNILSDNANGNVLIFRKTSAPAMPQDYLSSIGVPSFGTWHHLVFSYSFNGSSGSCKFYLDGSLIETYTNTNYLGISNYPIRIGSDGTAVANTVDGFMDDVAIYNRALTPTEINQLYTNPTVTPPVACTPFLGEDQTVCSGTSVTLDASSALESNVLDSLTYLGTNGGHYYYLTTFNSNPSGQLGAELTPAEMQNLISPYGGYLASIQSSQENTFIANALPTSTFAVWIGLSDYIQEGSYVWLNGTPASYYAWRAGEPNNQGNEDFTIMYGATSYPGAFSLWNDEPCGEGGAPCNPFYFVIESNTPLETNSGSFLWSTGATTASISVTPTQTTTYTCTVTDANGNACTDSVTVFVPQIETTDLTICAGESTTLSVSGINSAATPSACPTLPSNLQTGLIGYWPFCGNANDASGNGNNGTVNGATLTTDRFGNANSAYYFNGLNTSIHTNDSPSISLNGDLTMSAWKFEEASNQSYHTLISKRLNGNWSYNLVISKILGGSNLEQNKIFTGRRNNGGLQTEYRFSDAQVAEGVWQHVAVTISNNQIKFYINGVDAGNILGYNGYSGYVPNGSVFTIPMINQAVGLTFGDNGDGGSERLKGNLDDVSIFNRALSPAEILQLYTLNSTTYLWSTGATTSNISVTPTQTTTYTCTITTNGVSCTYSVTVVVNNPTLNLGSDVTACGTSTTLTAPTGYDSYAWSNGGTTNTTTVTANGTYTCTVTQGGCSASDAVDVTLIDATISATDSVICAGESTTLSVPQGGSSNTACAVLPTNLQTGLVGYWPFCGNANDASGNGNNGTVNGATLTTDRFGNANSAYSFDGNDYVSTAVTRGQLTSNFSISFFERYTGSSSAIYSAMIGGSDATGGTQFFIGKNAGNTYLGIEDGNYNGNFTTNGAFFDGQWNHMVIVKIAGVIYLYRNGNLEAQGNFVGCNDSEVLIFGNEFEGPGYFWNGQLDDILIFNRSLSTSEIQQLYNLSQTSYSWSNGATTSTINVSPTSTTTYTCTVTTNGVLCTDDITVAVNNPAIDLGADVTVCGTSTTLTAPSGYDSYLWSNGGTTNTTTVSANGTYTCSVTQGGCSATDAVDVTLINATVSASDSAICAGQSVTLSVPQGALTTPSACPTLPTNLQTGLVGYWPFCGNTNDVSGNGNNGTVNGATLTADRFGNANSAYLFNSLPSSISTTASPIVSNNPRTFSLWIKPMNSLLSTDEIVVFGAGGSPVLLNGFNLVMFQSLSNSNQIDLGVDLGGSWVKWNTSIIPGSWNHVAVQYSSTFGPFVTNCKLYLNGIEISTASGSFNPTIPVNTNSASNFILGVGGDINQQYYGSIDDVWFFNRVLPTAEIQQLYILGQTTYLWSNGATTPTINVSPTSTTTYTCTVTTNGVSCTDDITVVVSQPVASITPNGIVEICQGQSIALTANGGVSYLWNTGAPTQSITVNTEAVYTVTVTDANGCTDTESQLVKLNQLPNIGVNNASICPGQSAALTATGGVSYAWSPATGLSATTGSTVTATPATSTLYTVTGTSANGCANTATAAVTVNALPTATITPATATTFCQGGSVVLNANTGTGLTYQWFNNATAIGGATSASYTATTSGSYTVVITNASTCSSTSTATVVTVNALPTATISPATATTFCQGGSVVLNANTGTGFSYQWFNNATSISGATTASYSATTSGSYTVVVTNASTCSSTSTATVVTVNALPTTTITPASATTFCQGGSVVLNANTGTGLTYQWFNNATAISGATAASYTATTSGSYTVVVTNASTCSSTSTATVVTVNALPIATITPATATTFCQGGSVVLNANTGTGLTYQWRLNGTNITGATSSSYTANASGSYTVIVTNASTCSSTSTATVVTVNALPAATITAATATTFCQGGSVVLNANTGTGLTYQWFNNATAISGATSSSYTANVSGSYTLTVTNASACSSTSTATVVTVNALPTATITPAAATTFCQGGSVVLNANTGTGLTYQWKLNGTNITGATSSSYTANASGSYTVTVTNASTCSSTSTATVVTVNALPTATITPATATTFCQGGSVVLNANTGAGLTYQWFNNASAISGATSATYTATISGSYTVVVTNASSCSSTSAATVVTVNALPTATITPATATTFCQGGSVLLNANTGTGLTYQWFNNASAISGATAASYTATTSGSYTVTVTNASACSSTSTAVLVTTIANVDYFADADGDGFGDVTSLISTCVQPQGYVTDNTDCDDTNADINTAAAEVCNHIDDDCSGAIDDGLIFNTYYADADGDTYGDANNSIDECSQPSGYVTNNTDCNDNNANQNAATAEICNGEDDDCDGNVDNGITFLDYYTDADGDGFGTGDVISSCSDLGAGYVTNNTDCDDTNSNSNPSATETCNTIDDNCDGQIDEGVQTVYFIDNDGDTYGNPSVSILACTQPVGYTPDDNDCNDTDASINPGAEDIGGNGIDENCDGEIDNSIFELNATINLYPNPTRSELNIQISSALVGNEMYIFDAVGKLVYKQQLLSTQTTLSMSEYADGNYIFRVGEVVKRFEVMK